MDYCGPRGIAYAEFIDGSRWSPLSRDAALAWQQRENARCSSCGQVKADWCVHDDDGNVVLTEDGHPKAMEPPPLLVGKHWCPGCSALDTRRRNQGKEEREQPGVTLAFKQREVAAKPAP